MDDAYFSLRNVAATDYNNFAIPAYVMRLLPDKRARILDFGCGFGQLIEALHRHGFAHVAGADISAIAIRHLLQKGLDGHDLAYESDFFDTYAAQFDFIIMSHVLEHIPKTEMTAMLVKIRSLLRDGGQLLIMVPNAQSNTHGYWAYEDFTHTTLFTSGSLLYVLHAAGFTDVMFVDKDCTAGLSPLKAVLKKCLLSIYKTNKHFWNKVTSSAFHAPSPLIFSYEIKAVAKN